MEHHNCLNCNQALLENFCQCCGQKTSTHRYSMKHFIEHDVIHGVWHFDKGMIYTIKELFTRPGHSIREYIEGKRVQHFHFVSFILILLAFSSFLVSYQKIHLSDLVSNSSKESVKSLEDFSNQYPRLMMMTLIPISSLFSFWWFRKARFNYTEHLVLNSYKTIADMFVGLFFSVLMIFYTDVQVLSFVYGTLITGFSIFYTIWFYYQFFSNSGFSKKSLIWRSVLAMVSPMIFTMIITIVSLIFKKLY